MTDSIALDELTCELKDEVASRIPDANLDLCLTCGACTGGCPASGQFDMDPRKFLRMLLLGMDEEIVKNPWVWVCTMCGRCVTACPMKINIPKFIFNVRAAWPREKRPKGIRGSCDQHIRSGNAMGVPKEDFVFTIEDVAEEIKEEQPDFSDLNITADRVGAHMVLNQNSREPVTEPDEMSPLWKVLHLTGVDWTYPTVMWGGENYCMFLADDEGWRYIMEEFAHHIEHTIKAKVVINTE